ncbi:MAG: dipeptidase [Rhodobiaceae bacterium]|nr:dipeptidase [Rhodobiaceae bacterium]
MNGFARFFVTSRFTLGTLMAVAVASLPLHAEENISDAETISKAQEIHAEALVLDAHADIVIPSTSLSYLGEGGVSKVSPEKLLEGGVSAVVMSVAVGPGPRTAEGDAAARALADEKLAAALELVSSSAGDVVLATTAKELKAAKVTEKPAILLGFQNARSLAGDVDALNYFYDAGVRVFGLNHLGHNDFSDSSRPIYDGATKTYEPTEEHGGLSPLGIAAIERINALGGVVDISQMSKSAALQTISLSQSPVIASHSNVQAISNVTRNLSDEEIDLIGEKGGVIHVAAFGAYLVALSDPEVLDAVRAVRTKAGLPEEYSYPYELYWELEDPAAQRAFLLEMRSTIGRGGVADMIAHINYIVDRIGVDHVGIGNDFNHGSSIDGYADASEALNVTIALVHAGYSAEDIQKIWGGNFLRVLQQAENLASID